MSRDTLLYGLQTQLAADGAETTQQIARFLLEQRRGLRLLDRALRYDSFAKAFAVGNAARCALRMTERGPSGGVLAFSYRANERRATDEVHAMLDMPWCDIELAASLGFELEPRRLARIAGMLARRYEPFRMLRAVEMLAFHARLSSMLERYRVAVMSSYSNPWGIALNVAARRRGMPIVLVMHGMPQWPVPRLDYDLAIVNNRAAHETLVRAGCRIDRVIVKSGLAHYRPIKSLPAIPTVGVLLSKDPDPARVRAVIDELAPRPVIVRKHPANLWDGVDALASDRVSISTLPSSLDDVRRCDVVIAGNSSVHVDAVTAGVPSVYVRDLDRAGDDILGFVRDGLICDDLDTVQAFYARPTWRAALGKHVNLEQDQAAVAAETRAAFQELGA